MDTHDQEQFARKRSGKKNNLENLVTSLAEMILLHGRGCQYFG